MTLSRSCVCFQRYLIRALCWVILLPGWDSSLGRFVCCKLKRLKKIFCCLFVAHWASLQYSWLNVASLRSVVRVRHGDRAARDGNVVAGSRRRRRCLSRDLPGQHWSVSAQSGQRFVGLPGWDWPALQHRWWVASPLWITPAWQGRQSEGLFLTPLWIEHTDNILICVEFKLLSLNLPVMQIRLLWRPDGERAAFSLYSYPRST